MSYNSSSDSDLDRNVGEALDRAEAILERYVVPANLAPVFEVNPDSVIASYSEQNRVPTKQALGMYQSGLKSLCTSERTRFEGGRVSLDTSGLAAGRTWSVPGPVRSSNEKGEDFTDHELVIPQIVFCSLSLDSAMYVPNEVEAVAVHYLPGTRVVTKIRKRDGVPYQVSDDYVEGGYLGIARTFASAFDAKDARDELVSAVRAYGEESRSAREPDAFEAEAAKSSAPSVVPII